jgi:hypothetical protein
MLHIALAAICKYYKGLAATLFLLYRFLFFIDHVFARLSPFSIVKLVLVFHGVFICLLSYI